MGTGNIRRYLIATDQDIPTDQVKGISRDSKDFLKVFHDGELVYPEDIPKEGKTSLRIQKGKPGQVEKVVKKRRQSPRPSIEILHKAKDLYPKGEGIRVLRALYRYSLFRQKRADKYYNGTATQSGRYYSWGQEWLAKRVGVQRKVIWKWLKRFKADGFICVRYHGYKDRGSSILELAYNEAHRRFLQGINKRRAETFFT